MLAFLRLMATLLVVLSIAFVALSVWSRRKRRARLERHWARKNLRGDRDAFIRRGLAAYDRSVRRWLILGVYILPLAAIAIIVYVTNFM